jgi:hypothetical protein
MEPVFGALSRRTNGLQVSERSAHPFAESVQQKYQPGLQALSSTHQSIVLQMMKTHEFGKMRDSTQLLVDKTRVSTGSNTRNHRQNSTHLQPGRNTVQSNNKRDLSVATVSINDSITGDDYVDLL